MASKNLKGKENLLFAALEHAACGIAVIDREGTLIYINPTYAAINGYKVHELLGESFSKLTLPKDKTDLPYVLEAFNRLESKTSGDRVLQRRDGTTVDIHFTIEKINLDGQPYTLVTLQDITNLREVQNELLHKEIHIKETALRNEEIRKLIMNAALDAIICTDRNGRITFWNPQAERIFGWAEDEVLGKKMLDIIIPKEKRSVHERELAEYLKSGHGPTFNILLEIEAMRRDGTLFFMEITVLPLAHEESEFFCAFIRDISDRKNNEVVLKDLNAQLNRSVDQLGRSNLELEQFAYIASHDLQEPLRMVTGFLTQLDKKYRPLLDDKGREYLYYAVDGAVRMRQIILDLLEYSRSDKMDAPLEIVDLNKVIEEIIGLNRDLLEDLGGKISYSALPSVHARRLPITQVFQNLIGNAIKYSRSGHPPKIEIVGTEEEDFYKFSVTDNGIGIAQQHFAKIFIVFQRLHLREQYSGTGIGLAICKKIVEGYGGRIWVESEPDKGSTFYFTIRK